MLERLRMQEVRQVVFTIPEGVKSIGNKSYKTGEPIMIINKPSTSDLTFINKQRIVQDGRGVVGFSGQTSTLDFTINDGSVIFGLWSYIYGLNYSEADAIIKGNETVYSDNNIITLTQTPINLLLYKIAGQVQTLVDSSTYSVEDNQITLYENSDNEEFFAIYSYAILSVNVGLLKQIHNNILCEVDLYIDAIDIDTEEKHTIYIHIFKAQIDTDLKLFINNSTKASFTPIHVYAIPEEGQNLNKNVASIVVV